MKIIKVANKKRLARKRILLLKFANKLCQTTNKINQTLGRSHSLH